MGEVVKVDIFKNRDRLNTLFKFVKNRDLDYEQNDISFTLCVQYCYLPTRLHFKHSLKIRT